MKRLICALSVLLGVCAFSTIAYAAGWENNGSAWKYKMDNGQYATSGWQTIDGEYYYFDANGNLLVNTTTPDGCKVDADGKWIQEQTTTANSATAPDEFKQGYQYGDYSRFNSYASENGLGNTPIWIEGSYSSIFNVDVTAKGHDVTIYAAHVTDTNGNKWLVQLESSVLASQDGINSLIGHKVCIAGLYQGKSRVYNEPSMIAKKIYDINSGTIVRSTLGMFAS